MSVTEMTKAVTKVAQEEYKRGFNDGRKQWVGLTEGELKLLWEQYGYKSAMCKSFAHAIEAKLKEKNAA